MHPILFPDPALFEVALYSLEAKVLTLGVRTIRAGAKCPDCHQISNRTYSRYGRTVQDLPMAGFKELFCMFVIAGFPAKTRPL